MPITVKELDTTLLGDTLSVLSEKKLREVFKSVCAKSDAAREEAESQLLLILEDDDEFTDSPVNAAQQTSAPEETIAPRYTLCSGCKEDVDITADNTETSCRYHLGMCETHRSLRYMLIRFITVPSVADMGRLYFKLPGYSMQQADTKENREKWPEFFIFKCCGESLRHNPHGCQVDFHRAPTPGNRFTRGSV